MTCHSHQKEYRAKKWAAYYIANREVLLEKKTKRRQARKEADPKGVAKENRQTKLKQIGWSIEAYEAAFKAQNGKCEICKETLTKDNTGTGAAADHCHTTNVRRDILCMLCNKGLGNFKDDPKRLRAAADYIEKHRHKRILRAVGQ